MMDTTFKSTKSLHNIHFVKCGDCHMKGVPRRKERRIAANGSSFLFDEERNDE